MRTSRRRIRAKGSGKRRYFSRGRFAADAWTPGLCFGSRPCWQPPCGRRCRHRDASTRARRVAIRRGRGQIKELQLSLQAIAKSSGFLRDAGGSAIGDQKNHALGAGNQSLRERDQHRGVDAAFLRGSEPHMAARGDRRDQAHAMTRARGLNNRRFAFLTPGAPGVAIGTHLGRIAKIDLSPLIFRDCLDFQVFFLEPLPHEGFVTSARDATASRQGYRAEPTAVPPAPRSTPYGACP